MDRNKELRKVPAAILDPIATILDIDDDWKRVMNLIPKDLQSNTFEPKYNSEHTRLVEQHAQNNRLKCARVLFDEWGTAGRIRPTLDTLLGILTEAKMFRAAENLAKMINEKPPVRSTNGPEARIDTDNVTSILNHTTGEQYIHTRKLSDNCNGGSNGTYGAQCHDPTKKLESTPKMKSATDLMKFPNTEEQNPNFAAMGHHSTAMIRNNHGMSSASDLMKWTKEASAPLPSSAYLPNFDMLMPEGDRDSSSISTMSAASIGNSETSQSANDFTKSDNSQSSQLQTPNELSMYNQVYSEILEDTNLIQFQYAELEAITRHFGDSHIGSGGFGDVFVGDHEKHGSLAIKRAHSLQQNRSSVDLLKIFNTEVKSLSILRHENVVPILGFSLDGPAPCIVCKYIEGGSLLQNIAAKILNESQRMNIILGTAEGLKYIHGTEKPRSLVSGAQTSSRKAYFLHGDIKSANILITKDFKPKLCDFGLAKECATTIYSESIAGTSAYMAPERFTGTTTQKGDIFSYGIVLLELLTGLEPIISDNGDKINIKVYVEETCTDGKITSVLDPLVNGWSKAQKIYDVAKLCMKQEKNDRPSMALLCDTFHEINESEQRVFYAEV